MNFNSRYNLLLSLSLSTLAAACFVACGDSSDGTGEDTSNNTTDGGGNKDGSTNSTGDDSTGDDSTGDDDTTIDASTVIDGSSNVDDGSVIGDGSTAGDSSKPTHLVKGSVNGLLGTGLVLTNNGAGDLTITPGDGGAVAFQFASAVAEGSAYDVKVKTSPSAPTQACSVMGGAGVMGTSDVTATVTCSTSSYKVKGVVKGLKGAGLMLKNNGGDDLNVTANGGADVSFEFTTAVASGATYTVTAPSQPSTPTQSCTVTANDTGTVTNADVTNVEVTCTTTPFMVGGTVTGLTGAGLVLQNNGGDDLTINANGTFNFATKIDSGSNYAVTVKTAPSSPIQTCTVTANDTGTVGAADVANVTVNCAAHYPSSGLLAYWNFEQASPTVDDLSGNGNTATVRGAATQATAKVGKGYTLSGANQCVTVPNNASLSLNAAKAITMMMWVKVTNVASTQIFFNKENTWENGVNQSTGSAFEYALNANWAWYGTQTMTSGVWQHIATTWDGTTVTQYLNANGSFTHAQSGQLTGNVTGFGMGCRGVAADGTIAGSTSYLNGSIDEAFVYTRALTAQEVLNYYNATK